MKDFPRWDHARDWANCQHSNPNTRHYGEKGTIYKSNGRWCVSFGFTKPEYIPPAPEPKPGKPVNKFPWFNEGDIAVIEFDDGECAFAQRTVSCIPGWYVFGNEQEIADTDDIVRATTATVIVNGLRWRQS